MLNKVNKASKIFLALGCCLILLSGSFAKESLAQSKEAQPFAARSIFQSLENENASLAQTKAFGNATVFENAESKIANFLATKGAALGLQNADKQLSFKSKSIDKLGSQHLRYSQRVGQVPIFGAELTFHLKADLSLKSVSGKVFDNLALSTQPVISASQAGEAARKLYAQTHPDSAAEVSRSDLYVFNYSTISDQPSADTRLVWIVRLVDIANSNGATFFIDANNATLVYQTPLRRESVLREVRDCSHNPSAAQCELNQYDASTNYTYGRSEGQAARGANPIFGGNDTDSLYSLSGQIHDFYLTRFGRNGANDVGGTGDGVNYSSAKTTTFSYIDNHLYGGESAGCPNAFYDGLGSLNFCRGIVTADIIGHEYAHAVDAFSNLDSNDQPFGLNYQKESGALSESFADILGEATEYYVNGNNDWQIGEGSILGVIRDMSNPNAYGQPEKLFSSYTDRNLCTSTPTTNNDYGGVHHNNSILSYAAYLMAMGGTFNNCTIEAVGRAVEERILYYTLAYYLTINSRFYDAYQGILAACDDLYPSGNTCKQVKKALLAVELNQLGYCTGAQEQNPGDQCAQLDAQPAPTQTSTPTPLPGNTATVVPPTATATATPTRVPTIAPTATPLPLFSIKAGAGKWGSASSLSGGESIYLTLTRTASSGKQKDRAYLMPRVNSQSCGYYYKLDIGATPLKLVGKLPKVPKLTNVAFYIANEIYVTGTAKLKLKAERKWTAKSKSLSTSRICKYISGNLRRRS